MHPLFAEADQTLREVIGAAIEVHRITGPGLLKRATGTLVQLP